MLTDFIPVSSYGLPTYGYGHPGFRNGHRERNEWTIETGQRKRRSTVDPPQGFGNTFRLAPVAPEHAGQFDDRQFFRDTLQQIG